MGVLGHNGISKNAPKLTNTNSVSNILQSRPIEGAVFVFGCLGAIIRCRSRKTLGSGGFLDHSSLVAPHTLNAHELLKKNYTTRRFFCTRLTFFTGGLRVGAYH